MNKNLLFAMVLAVSTLLLFNYFNKSQVQQPSIPTQVMPGQAYKVPAAQDLARPINVEIDFIDKKITQKEDKKVIETDLYNISFSNYGGVISSIDFRKHLGINGTPLRTIQPVTFYQREQGAFLLALEEKTPYFYNFVGTKELDDQIEVAYQVDVDGFNIKKTYVLNKRDYKISLLLDFAPKSGAAPIRPRLFYPAPFVGEITDDQMTGFSSGVGGQSINKISQNELSSAWVTPSIFGAEDKYFAHCLVADEAGFVQRSFFKKFENRLYPVLEGPEIKEKGSWLLSFYVGPKLVDDLGVVDQRLEELLSFGWLSWLCKFLLSLLMMIVGYVKNYGFAIIVLTIVIKLPFTPLTMWGRKKMEGYQKYQPQINRIRTKFKSDLRRQQEEVLRFHKEHNISQAAPIMGCLPMLIQMPILFALYRVLGGYLDLYQAPFLGWIVDLSAKDPYYVLPVLMGASMLLQQVIAPVADAKQKTMMMFMPIVMTAVFINFPAGLVLYWLTNNVLAIGEDVLRKRITG